MGCDIHLRMEYRRDQSSPQWYTPMNGELLVYRDYRLFAKLAGVRGLRKEALVPPRGIPLDAEWETKEAWKEIDADGHTPSWLTVDEFERAVVASGNEDPHVAAWLMLARHFEKDHEFVRFVFWFDN